MPPTHTSTFSFSEVWKLFIFSNKYVDSIEVFSKQLFYLAISLCMFVLIRFRALLCFLALFTDPMVFRSHCIIVREYSSHGSFKNLSRHLISTHWGNCLLFRKMSVLTLVMFVSSRWLLVWFVTVVSSMIFCAVLLLIIKSRAQPLQLNCLLPPSLILLCA